MRTPVGRLLVAAIWLAGFEACDSAAVDEGNARFQVRESVRQLHITHADPGEELAVYDRNGHQVQVGTADKQGSLIFRALTPDNGYVVRTTQLSPPEHTRALNVMSPEGSKPSRDFYQGQKIVPGFNYIKTRDGTQLSAYVTLPGPVENGPYPTVVNYSGYEPSKPGMPLGSYDFLCPDFPTLCDAPNDPSALIISLFGYATVSVNLRGTGCSGGAYDFFETLQLLDGYDVIETVAAQEWVQFHKVGMTGLSYPGISQLFVASMQPPSLAAISPMSVIGNTASTLEPGGILNSGFAIEWVSRVLNRADPYGQGWEKGRVDGGDTVCAENQLLHSQKVDNVAMAYNTPYYVPAMADPLNPTYFAPQINVPVFLTGAWQDEQTGPYFTTLLDRMTGSPLARFSIFNGVHVDGLMPQVMAEWKYFLDFFVAHKIPTISPKLRSLAPLLFQQVFGADMNLPPERFDTYRTYDEALAAYRGEPPLRVIFENGGGKDPGAPEGQWERSFQKWPAPETQLVRYYFHGDGSLNDKAPQEAASGSSFKLDPAAGDRGNTAPGADVFAKLPKYAYKPLVDGKAVAFTSDPLTQDMLMMGTGSVDLWLKSTADDADLQVVITEVRPDGQEMYVQAGFLRASHRALGADSTQLWPSPTHLEKDAAPLPAMGGDWTQVRVAIAGFGHMFRAGSRIRISVDTPGGTRPEWRFLLKKFPGEVTHSISHSLTHPSSVALPLIPGIKATTPLPACPSLRGQPCRTYVPITNTPASN